MIGIEEASLKTLEDAAASAAASDKSVMCVSRSMAA